MTSENLNSLVINPANLAQLKEYLALPVQALLLTGPHGVGLGTIARSLAGQLAQTEVVYLAPSIHKKQKTAIINADDIAELIPILHDKRSTKLAVVIDQIDQTAPGIFERMLKLIEEPCPSVHYILTAHDLTKIPSTILSRTSLIRMALPSHEMCGRLYHGVAPADITKISFLANRRPALICRLANNPTELADQSIAMNLAKRFYLGSVCDRLEIIYTIKTKQQGLALCANIAAIAELAAIRCSSYRINQFCRRHNLLSTTADYLASNGNTRLQLINLAINF